MFANNFSRKAMTNTDNLLKGRDIPLSSYCVPVCAGWGQHSRLCCVLSHVPTLCDPMDCSPPGSSVHGILQARILEWVTTSFSRGSSWPRDQTCVSCVSSSAESDYKEGRALWWRAGTTLEELCPRLVGSPWGFMRWGWSKRCMLNIRGWRKREQHWQHFKLSSSMAESWGWGERLIGTRTLAKVAELGGLTES